MKKQVIISTIVIVAIGFGIYSCNKPDNVLSPIPNYNPNANARLNPPRNNSNTNGTDSSGSNSGDVNYFHNNLNLAFNDVNTILGITSTRYGRRNHFKYFNLCGAKVDTSNLHTTGIIVVNYDGKTKCEPDRVTRSGQITITSPVNNNWDSAGAYCNITFANYKISNDFERISLILNGTHLVTNVSGGSVSSHSEIPVVYKIQALAMSVTFEDGKERTWNSERIATIIADSATNHTITISEQGDTTLNGIANTAFWGTTRSGENFSVALNNYSSNSNCGFRNPTSGNEVYTLDTNSVTITYGVTRAGSPITSGCAYGYKEEWKTSSGVEKSDIIRYW